MRKLEQIVRYGGRAVIANTAVLGYFYFLKVCQVIGGSKAFLKSGYLVVGIAAGDGLFSLIKHFFLVHYLLSPFLTSLMRGSQIIIIISPSSRPVTLITE